MVFSLCSFVSPFQGFRFYGGSYQGLTPLAIICRPVGASEFIDMMALGVFMPGCR